MVGLAQLTFIVHYHIKFVYALSDHDNVFALIKTSRVSVVSYCMINSGMRKMHLR